MADVTSQEAIKFCNAKVRVAADKLAQAYYFAKLVQQEWFATSMASGIPNDASPILDGSATDGRHPITGASATAIVSRCMDLVSDMEAGGNAKLNTILAVAVNAGD